jgi:hypothetical protein
MPLRPWLKHLAGPPNRAARRTVRRAAPPRLVVLEDRTVPALTATLDGTDLIVLDTDATGVANQFTVSVVGTDLVVADAADTITVDPAVTAAGWTLAGDGKSVRKPTAAFVAGDRVVVNGAGGDDAYTAFVNQIPAAVGVVLRDATGANGYTYNLTGATAAGSVAVASGGLGRATVTATGKGAVSQENATGDYDVVVTGFPASGSAKILNITLNGGGTPNGQRDTVTISRDGTAATANQVVGISDAVQGSLFHLTVPINKVNTVTVAGTTDDDLLQLDYTNGTPLPTGANKVFYNALAGGADGLEFVAGTTAASFTFLNETDGSVTAGAIINYTGVDTPIIDSMQPHLLPGGSPVTRSFTYSSASETITVTDNGTPGDRRLVIDSDVGGQAVEFGYTNPTGQGSGWGINAGGGDDVININGVDSLGFPNFFISGGPGHDVVNLNTDIVLSPNRRFSIEGGTEVVATAPGVDVVTSGAASEIGIAADNLILDPTSTLVTDLTDGEFFLLPATAGNTLDLGGADVPGSVLGLSAQELSQITANRFRFGLPLAGGSPQSGPIRISAALGLPNALEVNILTFGEIVQSGGPVSVGAGFLAVGSVGTGYQPTNPGVDAVGSLGVVGNVLFTISGNTVDTEYPQLSVDGPLDLGAGDPIALVLAGTYVPQPGNVLTIVSAGSIVNTFDGLPGGSTVTFNGVDLRIDYTATAVLLTVPPSVSLDAANNLVVSGTGGDDDVTVSVVGTDLVITRASFPFAVPTVPGAVLSNGGLTIAVPLASIAGTNLTFDAFAGDDTLTLDFTGGSIPFAVAFNGGDGADQLVLGPATAGGVAHTFAGPAAGEVAVTGTTAGTVTYAGVESARDSLDAADRTFTFTGDAETIELAAGGVLANRITSNLTPSVEFVNPGQSLTILAGAGADVVTVSGVGAGFGAALSIDGGDDVDAANLNVGITFIAGNSLGVTAESVSVAAGVALVTSGAGAIAVATDTLALDPTSSLTSAGAVTIQVLTAGRKIDLGGADDADTLGLTAAELDRITAPVLTIGNPTAGTVTVSGAVALTHVTALTLVTGADIVRTNAAPSDVAVTALFLAAPAGVGTSATPLRVAVTQLAADTSGGNGSQFLAATSPATIAGAGLASGAGLITLASGSFAVTPAVGITGDVEVGSGAVLFGSGIVAGDLTALAGSEIRPGAGVGILTVSGDLTLQPGATVAVEVNGATAPGVGYDQLQVGGGVTLGGATLSTSGALGGGAGGGIRVIDSPGATPVSGAFAGLAEGAPRSFNGVDFFISYLGGDVTFGESAIVQLGAATFTGAEGGTITVVLTRTGGTDSAVTVTLTAAPGSAGGADVTPAAQVVTFAAGQTTATVSLDLTPDFIIEGDETFSLALSSPAGGAVLGTQATAVVTVTDDDAAGTLEFGSATYSGIEGGQVTVTVTRASGLGDGVSVTVTADVGGLNLPATVTFAGGQDTATLVLNLPDNTTVGPNTPVTLALTGPTSGATLGGRATATVTVADNETPGTDVVQVTTGANGTTQTFVEGPDGELVPVGDPFVPFPGFTGVVRSVSADVNGDGVADRVFTAGPGGTSAVRVVDGATGADLGGPVLAFESSFTGGAFVSAGDFDGDGTAEVVVSPDQGGGGRIVVLAVRNGRVVAVANFFGIDDPNFRGGARTAVGDVNGDGTPDLFVAAGFGGGPRVAVFDGAAVLGGTPTRLVNDFFAFPGADAMSLRNGTFLAAGDFDGDGFDDLAVGGGPGGGSRVFILSGALVSAGRVTDAQASPLANFFAFGSDQRGGVRVAAKDTNEDGTADLVVGSGEGQAATVLVYLGGTLAANPNSPTPDEVQRLLDGAVLTDGVFVG